MAGAPSEDSDQPGDPLSLSCPHDESLDTQLSIECTARTLINWADAQADLSLRWAHRSVC